MNEKELKWFWLMAWCKKKGLSPANEYNWQEAIKAHKTRNKNDL